jgi:hypothetical protein
MQEFDAETCIDPLTEPVILTDIDGPPCPEIIVTPLGTDQLYTAAPIALTEYDLLVLVLINSIIFPRVSIEVAVAGVIAKVLAVPAEIQELFTVILIFPFVVLHEKLYQTELVPVPDTIEAPDGAAQLYDVAPVTGKTE